MYSEVTRLGPTRDFVRTSLSLYHVCVPLETIYPPEIHFQKGFQRLGGFAARVSGRSSVELLDGWTAREAD
jgi:hypothetical protein